MQKIRLDLGGPKGNALYVMSTVRRLCGSADEEREIIAEMKGDVFIALGGKGNDYEGLLRVYKKHFPFVEFYATYDIGLPADLCTVDENPEVHEL